MEIHDFHFASLMTALLSRVVPSTSIALAYPFPPRRQQSMPINSGPSVSSPNLHSPCTPFSPFTSVPGPPLAGKFMGARFSASVTAVAISSAHLTAKVITPEGHLREYAGDATTVSLALTDCSFDSSSSFICDAESLFFGEPIPPMFPEDPVIPGRLYFVLPSEMSRHALTGADMRELSVRATSALKAAPSRGKKGGRRQVNKNKSHAPSKNGGQYRVAPMVDVGSDGDVDFNSGIKQHQRASATSQLRIHRAAAAAHRQAVSAGRKRRVARSISFRVRLGTIDEEAMD